MLSNHACLDRLEPCGRGAPGASRECPVTGWFDRGFTCTIPLSWDGTGALPVLFSFHGGGGNRVTGARSTCPGGATDSPRCLAALGAQAGYVVIEPDGTSLRPLRNLRAWNAGGGRDGFLCVSGGPCEEGVDDLAFFDALLADVERIVPVDRRRIFLAGMSNGGAISHRIACERPSLIAAIAAVGGANQFEVTGGVCGGPVAMLQIHGTEDPCWRYDGSPLTCSILKEGKRAGVDETAERWRQRNGCLADWQEEALPDTSPDGTRVVRRVWPGCKAATQVLRVEGGGHTWPGGYQFLDEETVGRLCRDIDANQEIVRFFDANPRP